ncbi:MAG: HDOD domain-containing protein, partial [Rhodobacterales bacterium]|nr:HDOD domain-containing protein [Rhodobacterales bacterium]
MQAILSLEESRFSLLGGMLGIVGVTAGRSLMNTADKWKAAAAQEAAAGKQTAMKEDHTALAAPPSQGSELELEPVLDLELDLEPETDESSQTNLLAGTAVPDLGESASTMQDGVIKDISLTAKVPQKPTLMKSLSSTLLFVLGGLVVTLSGITLLGGLGGLIYTAVSLVDFPSSSNPDFSQRVTIGDISVNISFLIACLKAILSAEESRYSLLGGMIGIAGITIGWSLMNTADEWKMAAGQEAAPGGATATKGDHTALVAPPSQGSESTSAAEAAAEAEQSKLDDLLARTAALELGQLTTRMQEKLGPVSTLPALPKNYQDICRVINDPYGTGRDIGNIVIRDIGLTTKILQVVNSPLYGLRSPVTDVVHAATLLGMKGIRDLTLTVEVFGFFSAKIPMGGITVEELYSYSVKVAAVAQRIGKVHAEDAYTAALLHQIGRIILMTSLSDKYQDALDLQKETGGTLRDAQRAAIGIDQVETSVYLLSVWGLPQRVIEAVAFYNRPSSVPHTTLDVVDILHVAVA